MLPDGAVGEKLVAFDDDLAEGWKIERIDDLETGGEFPSQKEGDHADDAKPVSDDLAGALPSPVGAQRVGLVDGNQLIGFFFLFSRDALLSLQCG